MWMVMFFIFYFFWCFANIESKQWISHQAIRFPIKWNFTRHLQRELMHLYDMGMTNDRYFIGISIASQFQSLLLQPKLSITRDTVDAVLCPPPKKKDVLSSGLLKAWRSAPSRFIVLRNGTKLEVSWWQRVQLKILRNRWDLIWEVQTLTETLPGFFSFESWVVNC